MNARADATVAVTGIGGFVGRHVALLLLRRGYDVRGTVRDLARAEEIERSIRAAGGTEAAKLSFAEADLLGKKAGPMPSLAFPMSCTRHRRFRRVCLPTNQRRGGHGQRRKPDRHWSGVSVPASW
ncbi:GDP-mannose 4,6-dehydratase [Ensifer sp. ENS10]|uniref:GDP-mannose 4,6-dehydratase n=1 Tax=unclassified Ensifer TaxID=2633371 RepID=UPI000DE5A862|nr:GDP-mannose 4,6-dehydratase [Ensifer sp. ENS10]MBV7520727.1 GDP-mannose 4,6-dehydratase [Ensifer sp. ENS12]